MLEAPTNSHLLKPLFQTSFGLCEHASASSGGISAQSFSLFWLGIRERLWRRARRRPAGANTTSTCTRRQLFRVAWLLEPLQGSWIGSKPDLNHIEGLIRAGFLAPQSLSFAQEMEPAAGRKGRKKGQCHVLG